MSSLMRILNVSAILANVVFVVALKNLPPQFQSYIDGFLLIIIVIFFSAPFIINILSNRSGSLSKPKIALGLLCGLVVVAVFSLIFMYQDQLETSRGFALLACSGIYLFLFLPLWLVYLNVCKKTVG
jgi:hypothetical protein